MGTTKDQAVQAIKNGAERTWVECEQPQHSVELSEYYIGKYPVTNHEYQAFVRDAKYSPPREWDGDKFPDGKGGHPVAYIGRDDAIAYCKWLSEKTKKQYRLPTEAEWEKAARGVDARIYPWGNEFDITRANVKETGIGDTTEVGQFSPQGNSVYGCADMVGNVWEWCNDIFNDNEYKNRGGPAVQDPQGPEKGTSRVLRGGSFDTQQIDTRCPSRNKRPPTSKFKIYGFRIALSPVKLENDS